MYITRRCPLHVALHSLCCLNIWESRPGCVNSVVTYSAHVIAVFSGRENGPAAEVQATRTTCVLYVMMNPLDLQQVIRVLEASRLLDDAAITVVEVQHTHTILRPVQNITVRMAVSNTNLLHFGGASPSTTPQPAYDPISGCTAA